MATQGLKTYTSTSAPTRLIGKDDDVTALYNKQYPNASQATPDTYAQSKEQIDQMSLRDRLWDAFNFTYGQQRRASDEQFANQISQQNRGMVSRGMQRSSYGAATEANMRNKQVQAQNDIYGQQLAAYEQALLNVEQQEREAEQWQKEFEEGQRQFNILHPQDVGGGGGEGSSGGRRGSGKKNTTDAMNFNQSQLNALKALAGSAKGTSSSSSSSGEAVYDKATMNKNEVRRNIR